MSISGIGFWAGITAFSATVLFDVAQVLQVVGVLHYPLDEIFIYGCSLAIVIPFMLAMLALHHTAPAGKRFFSHGAVLFTLVYALCVTMNYTVQLATVIPLTLRGVPDAVGWLQQTPHSLFWDLDAIGYIFMGFAMLMAIPVFRRYGIQQRVRYAFLANGLVTPLIAFVYFYPTFSTGILLLAAPWGVTAPLAMLLLALYFRQHKTPTI